MARKLLFNDEEGGMAKAQLLKIETYAKKLNEMIHPDDELEAWVQSKLSVVAAYMGDVKHYLDYELKKYGYGGSVEGINRYEVEFTWDKQSEDDYDGRKVNVIADSVEEAAQKVTDKFSPYYKGFKIVEVELEEKQEYDNELYDVVLKNDKDDDDDDDDEDLSFREVLDKTTFSEGLKESLIEDLTESGFEDFSELKGDNPKETENNIIKRVFGFESGKNTYLQAAAIAEVIHGKYAKGGGVETSNAQLNFIKETRLGYIDKWEKDIEKYKKHLQTETNEYTIKLKKDEIKRLKNLISQYKDIDERENNIIEILRDVSYPLTTKEYQILSKESGYKLGDIIYVHQKMNDDIQYDVNYAKGGELSIDSFSDIDELNQLWRGYATAILFAETDLDTGEPLEIDYAVKDFDAETVSESKNLLRKFYLENKDAIDESGLDLETIGNNIWYARAGHGAGFFDYNLDQEVEDKLTKAAKSLGEYPTVETYDGKISVRGGRVFNDYAKGGEVKLGLGQPVSYRGELYEVTQKDGVTHLTLNREGAWGSDYPTIPLSMVNQDELRNIDGKKVFIPYTFEKGGKVKKKRKWIQEALTGDEGVLRKTAKRKGLIEGDENLSMTDLKKLQKMGGKTAKRAYLAETLRSFDK